MDYVRRTIDIKPQQEKFLLKLSEANTTNVSHLVRVILDEWCDNTKIGEKYGYREKTGIWQPKS